MKKVLLGLAIIAYACTPGEESKHKFEDPIIVKIHDLKDRRIKDSLFVFLKSENKKHKIEAILAFGSIQDSTAIPRLSTLLVKEQDPEILKAVAFAMGQTRCLQSRMALLAKFGKSKDPDVEAALIHSYGRVTHKWVLPKRVQASTPQEKSALAWALYYAGLRGLSDSTMNAKAAELLASSNPEQARVGAAHYFSRGAKAIERHFPVLQGAALHDSSVDVRMAAVAALRKVVQDTTLVLLKKIASSNDDYRVRVNATRGLQAFPFEQTKNELLQLLDDRHHAVTATASEVIKSKMGETHWIEVANKAGALSRWRDQANLYEAVLKVKQLPTIRKEVIDAYTKSSSPFQKSALIFALQHDPASLDVLMDEFAKADTVVIKTAAASAITSINRASTLPSQTKSKILTFYKSAVEEGDPGVIGIVAGALQDPKLGYKESLKDISFLRDARAKLSLPKDFESVQPLEQAIAYLEGKEVPKPVTNTFNHPIDWEVVKAVGPEEIASVYTSKGKITMRLLVDEAPGSVANFVALARSGYFNKKAFHRVVPNFVIQGGCNRGDGSGGLDYSIRSEFSQRRYKTGSVGMASAGKDTEGTQWFITHSPTPHLDGSYTIFAEVIDGMEAVHQIEVGDEITKVVIGQETSSEL